MLSHKMQLTLDTVKRFVRRSATPNLEKLLNKTHFADIAFLYSHLNSQEQEAVLKIIMKTPSKCADFISELSQQDIIDLISTLSIDETLKIFKEMANDDVADILNFLPDELSDQILQKMHKRESENVETLMKYPEDTAGGIMTTEFLALHEDMTVKQAIEEVQKAAEAELVFYVYVVDDRSHLVGVLSLQKLILVHPNTKLSSIMVRDVEKVNVNMDQEDVSRLVSRYNILAIPVVDDENKLAGIITVDDIIDVIKEEETEDMIRMTGTSPEEGDILEKSVLGSTWRRLPWLFATFFGGLIMASFILKVEVRFEKIVALTAFVPIIVGMGGNVGNQSATLVVRGLAMRKIAFSQLFSVAFKEIRVGVSLGIIFGTILGFFAPIYYQESLYLGLSIGLGILCSMTIAATIGVLIPMILDKLGFDPAISTGPFVSSLVDLLGLLNYFVISGILLHL